MNPNAVPRRTPAQDRTFAERRLHQRYHPHRNLTAQVETADGGSLNDASVQNLSARGIGLVCSHPCPAGTELRLQLLNASATYYLIVTLRVLRCDPVLAGGHYLGCEFTRKLEPGELRPFLA